MITITLTGRRPDQTYYTIGVEADSGAETLSVVFPAPYNGSGYTRNLRWIAADGTADTVDITSGGWTIDDTITSHPGRAAAYVTALQGETIVWHSMVWYLLVGDLPDIDTSILRTWPSAVEYMLAQIAAHNVAMTTADTAIADYAARAETAQTAAETAAAGVVTAEAARQTAEAARQTAEAARQTAEAARASAESERESNESTRVSSEAERVTAETDRESAESTRNENETARQTAEGNRAANETARQSAEGNREDSETERAAAELARASTETERAAAESVRASKETARQTAENHRAAEETARQTAEGNRVSAEESRATAETARAAAEESRVTAETDRASASATATAAANTAAQTANTAAANAPATSIAQGRSIFSDALSTSATGAGLAISPVTGSTISVTGTASGTLWRTGRNLIRNASTGDVATNGITFTLNADKSVTINGTATANANYYLWGGYSNLDPIIRYAPGDYRFSTGLSSDAGIRIGLYSRATASDSWTSLIQTPTSAIFSPTDYGYVTCVFVYVTSGTTVSDVTIYPMLTLGSMAYDYEPYNTSSDTAEITADMPLSLTAVSGTNTLTASAGTLTANYNKSLPVAYAELLTRVAALETAAN